MIERGREPASGPDEHGRTFVLVEADDEVASAYNAIGTSSAVLVDAKGRIASSLAPGAEAISRLVASETDGAAPALEQPDGLGRRDFLVRLAAGVASSALYAAGRLRRLRRRARGAVRRDALRRLVRPHEDRFPELRRLREGVHQPHPDAR